jgi:hypothetical protein
MPDAPRQLISSNSQVLKNSTTPSLYIGAGLKASSYLYLVKLACLPLGMHAAY